jgi:hypothetical protein
MPFRFRRILSLGKGLRINLSKSGLSTSIGKPGASLNLGSRPRVTISAPGTGMSYSQPIGSGRVPASRQTKTIITLVISLFLLCFITACCIGVIFSQNEDPSTKTRTDPIPLSTDFLPTYIAATYSAASTQTRIAEPFTSTPFIYNSPVPVITSTYSYLPTLTPIPSNTPFVLTSPTLYFTGDSDCPCTGDLLDCKDFQTHQQAQACYNKCLAAGVGDIHRIDQEGDGQACESLP